MELTTEMAERIEQAVTAELVERAWEKIESQLEEVTCFSVQRLAGMLDLSTAQTRRVLMESIDFGPRDTRVSLAQAKKLVEARTTKAA